MNIETRRFGMINVSAQQVITFVGPIIGFHRLKQFVLLDDGAKVGWLQSIEDPGVSFPVIDPYRVYTEYTFSLPSWDETVLEVLDMEDLMILTITVLSRNPSEVRTNLRAPVVINKRKGLAKQVILPDTTLPICHHFVF